MAITKELEKLGFVEAEEEINNLVLDIYGVQGQGKTHLALTAPAPIAYFDFDYGSKGLITKFKQAGKEIFHKPIEIPNTDSDNIEQISIKSKPIWMDFAKAWDAVMHMPKIRTVILDTATEAYELLRIYKFGRLSEVMPHMYGPVKAIFRRTLKMASTGKGRKNLIMINKMKDEYVGRNATGNKIEAGFDDAPYIADVAGRMIKTLPSKRRNASEEEKMAHFKFVVAKCRVNTDLEGEEFTDENCNFQMIATLAVPGTIPDDWE